MIYFPRKYDHFYHRNIRKTVPVVFRTSQGEQTAFYLKPKVKDVRSIWILFGGNGSLAIDWMPLLENDKERKSGYLLVDYPGYGKCNGNPYPASILESSEEALKALFKLHNWDYLNHDISINIMGHSLGAATGLQFSTRINTNKIILISPFTRMVDMGKLVVGYPLCYLVKHKFDNTSIISKLVSKESTPKIIIIHGDNDEVIPVRMGRVLAQLKPEIIDYYEIPGGDHNSIISDQTDLIIRRLTEDE